MNIEVEIRSFIDKEDYERLLDFFHRNARLITEENQETHYLDVAQDLRIQRNESFSKIWMKEGLIHDEAREETEIKFDKEDFEKMKRIFSSIGIDTSIKWIRQRHLFDWNGITVAIDDTKGYGRIIELEKISDKDNKDTNLALLKDSMKKLGINPTPREEFEKRLEIYKSEWKSLGI